MALVDLRLPGESGLTVIREFNELDPSTVVVVLTGYGSIATAVESIKLGAASYLTKPADADQIMAAFDGTQPEESVEVPSLARVEWEHIQRVLTDCGGTCRAPPSARDSSPVAAAQAVKTSRISIGPGPQLVDPRSRCDACDTLLNRPTRKRETGGRQPEVRTP